MPNLHTYSDNKAYRVVHMFWTAKHMVLHMFCGPKHMQHPVRWDGGWICLRSDLVPGSRWTPPSGWLRNLRGLSLIQVSWLQPVYGDRILAVSELEDKMLLGAFHYFVRALIRVLEW